VKLWVAQDGPKKLLVFECPGCEYGHSVEVPRWTWNGSMEKPTFHPSIKLLGPGSRVLCHCWVKDGRIQFLADCEHKLAGQTVDLPEVEV
jgi:hypothetical protein